jgi:hypothetical protein
MIVPDPHCLRMFCTPKFKEASQKKQKLSLKRSYARTIGVSHKL